MATLTPLQPDSTGTNNGITDESGGTTNLHLKVTDGLDSTYLTAGVDVAGSVLLGLSNVDADFDTMDSFAGNFRVQLNGTVADDTIDLLVLKAAAADATLKDLDDVAAILANGSTTEADFTNYARKVLASLTVTVDDTADDVEVDAADVTFTSAGGASNNTTTDVVIYEDVDGTDANAIPLVQLDAVFTTDGNDVTLSFDPDGWFGAS